MVKTLGSCILLAIILTFYQNCSDLRPAGENSPATVLETSPALTSVTKIELLDSEGSNIGISIDLKSSTVTQMVTGEEDKTFCLPSTEKETIERVLSGARLCHQPKNTDPTLFCTQIYKAPHSVLHFSGDEDSANRSLRLGEQFSGCGETSNFCPEALPAYEDLMNRLIQLMPTFNCS